MGAGEIFVNARFAYDRPVVTVVVTSAGLLGLHQENSSLSITARDEWCCTLLT